MGVHGWCGDEGRSLDSVRNERANPHGESACESELPRVRAVIGNLSLLRLGQRVEATGVEGGIIVDSMRSCRFGHNPRKHGDTLGGRNRWALKHKVSDPCSEGPVKQR